MYFSDEGKPVHYDNWPDLWMLKLMLRYEAIKQVRFCPTAPERDPGKLKKDSSPEGWVTRAWLVDGGKTNYQGSYAINGYLYTDSPYGNPKNMIHNESDITQPSKTPFFADAIWVDAWPEVNGHARSESLRRRQIRGRRNFTLRYPPPFHLAVRGREKFR
jgi:hypothetical protein